MKVKVHKKSSSLSSVRTERRTFNEYKRIPESQFCKMINAISKRLNNPIVINGPMKYFPDANISALIKYFDLEID